MKLVIVIIFQFSLIIINCDADLKISLPKKDINYYYKDKGLIITSVKDNLVLLNLGENYNIKKNMIFTIYRGYERVGVVKIFQIFSDASAAYVMQQDSKIRKYDKVLFGKKNSIYIKKFILNYFSVSVETLTELAKNSDLKIRALVAYNCRTPKKILQTLYLENKLVINKYLAFNFNAPSEILNEIFLKNKYNMNGLMKVALSLNTSIPKSTLSKLALDDLTSKSVKMSIALNENTSMSILRILIISEEKEIKLSVLKNKNCSEYLLYKLMKDQSLDIRLAIANHKNVNEKILNMLQKDKSKLIKKIALKKLKTLSRK